jgi:thiamine transporter
MANPAPDPKSRTPGPSAVQAQRESTRALAYGGMAIALATVLSLIVVWKMPQGGTITAASMLPLVFFALAFGLRWGVLAGAVFGLLQMALPGAFLVQPVQVLLDYPIAFAALGLAGLFSLPGPKRAENVDILRRLGALPLWTPVAGTFLAMAARTVAHVLSGVVFFASYAPEGQDVWLYSLVYNGSYMLPEAVVTTILLTVFLTGLHRAYKPLRPA